MKKVLDKVSTWHYNENIECVILTLSKFRGGEKVTKKIISGAKIRALREKRKMLQQELADMLGVDRTAVTKWENGTKSPRSHMLPALAKFLKCKKIDDLYEEVESDADQT